MMGLVGRNFCLVGWRTLVHCRPKRLRRKRSRGISGHAVCRKRRKALDRRPLFELAYLDQQDRDRDDNEIIRAAFPVRKSLRRKAIKEKGTEFLSSGRLAKEEEVKRKDQTAAQ